jgi:hypothetical protein
MKSRYSTTDRKIAVVTGAKSGIGWYTVPKPRSGCGRFRRGFGQRRQTLHFRLLRLALSSRILRFVTSHEPDPYRAVRTFLTLKPKKRENSRNGNLCTLRCDVRDIFRVG